VSFSGVFVFVVHLNCLGLCLQEITCGLASHPNDSDEVGKDRFSCCSHTHTSHRRQGRYDVSICIASKVTNCLGRIVFQCVERRMTTSSSRFFSMPIEHNG
jgi:hypothetical protein